MKGHTYRDLAKRYEFDVCFGECGMANHRGRIDTWGIVHWADRRVTRSGLRRFLILCWHVSFRELRAYADEATDLWASNTFAYRTALHDLRIRLPASLAAADKAKARALLATAPFEVRNGTIGRWAGIR